MLDEQLHMTCLNRFPLLRLDLQLNMNFQCLTQGNDKCQNYRHQGKANSKDSLGCEIFVSFNKNNTHHDSACSTYSWYLHFGFELH